jgi:hypothetical protein
MNIILKLAKIMCYTALVLLAITIYFAFSSSSYKTYNGYLVDKKIDTVLIQGKHVHNVYGYKFALIYQEDKTGNRYKEYVSKEKYNSTIIGSMKLIQFK